MPYHEWGDKWFQENEKDLYEAMDYIASRTYRLSLCRIIMKEKYGTVRYEYLFPPGTAVWNRYRIKIPFTNVVLFNWNDSRILRVWYKVGRWALRKSINEAAVKWPKVKEEVLADV